MAMRSAIKALLIFAFTTTAFAQDPAMDILHRTAEAYRIASQTEFKVTIQEMVDGGARVSERAAFLRPEFDQIDQHIQKAAIAREERYIHQGKPVSVVVVQVIRDQWPSGTLPGTEFAMYRIDEETYEVDKVSAFAGSRHGDRPVRQRAASAGRDG